MKQTMKTAELTGTLLDYWVAKAEGFDPIPGYTIPKGEFMWKASRASGGSVGWLSHKFSRDWALGGPIIEREPFGIFEKDDGQWAAGIYNNRTCVAYEHGPTMLIAAMRAFVSSKLGDEVPNATA